MQTRLMPRFTRAKRVESAKADSAFRFAEDTVNVYGQRWTRRTQATCGLFHEMVCQQPHVLQTLTQRWHFNGKDTQPIIQVEPKPTRFGFDEQIAIGGCDEAYLNRARAVVAKALELSFLQDAKQFALQVGRDFTDLIQK